MSGVRGDRSLREERVRRARDARRWLLAATLAGCATIGAWAPVAGAATVTHLPGATGASYTAGSGELNRLTVGGTGALVELFDAAGITAPDPEVPPLNDCITPAAGAAICHAAQLTASLGDGDDTVTTLDGAPALTVSGGAGGDALLDRTRSPGTVFQGGEGLDRADYSGRAEAVTVSLNDVADDGAAEGDNVTVEDLVGGGGSDAITGDGGANGLSGGPGNDGIDGGGGSDVLVGGPGDDAMNGGDGNDQLIGGAGVDSFAGGPGADSISAADGVEDVIDCGGGADTAEVDRGAGGVSDVVVNCETLTGASATSTVRAPSAANPADLTPPAASMRAAIRQRIATVRVHGVSLRVLCRESCGLSAALALDRPATRRLGLGTRAGGAVIGKATARRRTPGAVRMRVKLSRRARQALARTRKVAVTVQVLVSDASGNGTLLQRRITLVR
jgi:Ca2+-binding RTX toxin-like protein